MSEIPLPISNYIRLIREKESPYYDLIRYVISDMEKYYLKLEFQIDTIYMINPRQLQKEMKEKIGSDKLTKVNVARTILAMLYGSNLRKEEDYYVTTSTGGRRNYHIKLSPFVLSALRSYL